jgi:hypothetical protein
VHGINIPCLSEKQHIQFLYRIKRSTSKYQPSNKLGSVNPNQQHHCIGKKLPTITLGLYHHFVSKELSCVT